MDRFKTPKISLNLPKKDAFRLPPKNLIDKAKVQLGGQAPVFRKIPTGNNCKLSPSQSLHPTAD